MRTRTLPLWFVSSVLGLACEAPALLVPESGGAVTSTAVAEPPARLSSSASAPPPASAAAGTEALPAGEFKCGALTCRAFESPVAAFKHVLERTTPRVLALGESHAQKGGEAVRSTTSRFTDDFLPLLEGQATSLVLELWVSDGKCGKAKEKQVAEKQKVVTENQAADNQNEFVKLGEKSRSLKIVPHILRPTCAEYDQIQKAGDNAVLEMLTMITRNMRDKTRALYAETEKKFPGRMVVTYGGAMHNDLAPKPGREDWSFAAELDKLAPGKYVELDLIVPEFIKDNNSWRGLPWFESYDRDRYARSTLLIKMADRSYALIFSRSDATR